MLRTAATALKFETSKRSFNLPVGRPFFQIPKELEPEVLLYADRKHQGLAEAYRRIKSWTDFPDLKRKVIIQEFASQLKSFFSDPEARGRMQRVWEAYSSSSFVRAAKGSHQ